VDEAEWNLGRRVFALPVDDRRRLSVPRIHSAERRTALREREMGVLIIREMVGTSTRSWSDAARNAVATASRTVRNIREIEVVKSSARVEDGEIVEYRVELKLHFEYEGG
jgi:flavin-binding protein dodecin